MSVLHIRKLINAILKKELELIVEKQQNDEEEDDDAE